MNTESASLRKIYRNLGTIFGAAQFILFDPEKETVVFADVQEELGGKKIEPVLGEDYSTIFITSSTTRIWVETPAGQRVEYDQTEDDIRQNLKRIVVRAYFVFLGEQRSEVSLQELFANGLEDLSPIDGEDYSHIVSIKRSDTSIEVQRRKGRKVAFSISGWLEDNEEEDHS
ncbi:MAG: hypothetical protein K0Q55_1900 [Verrucomicrobia bacterium]|jgi:hypothetical protein|nr:hypothetical protein [Verrucomicrobiota bacterium]